MAQDSEAYSAFGWVIRGFFFIQTYSGINRIPQGVSRIWFMPHLLWHGASDFCSLLERNPSLHLFSCILSSQKNCESTTTSYIIINVLLHKAFLISGCIIFEVSTFPPLNNLDPDPVFDSLHHRLHPKQGVDQVSLSDVFCSLDFTPCQGWI